MIIGRYSEGDQNDTTLPNPLVSSPYVIIILYYNDISSAARVFLLPIMFNKNARERRCSASKQTVENEHRVRSCISSVVEYRRVRHARASYTIYVIADNVPVVFL